MTADELERASFKRYGRAVVIRAPQPVERPTKPIPYVTLDEIAELVVRRGSWVS